MSPFDPDLLRRLADADAALPPAPGREFSPASLRDLAARRTRRQVLVLLAASLLIALLCVWPHAAQADEDAWREDGMRALRAEVEALGDSLREWSIARAASERAAAEASLCSAATAKLRLEIAHARAGAVLAGLPPMPVEETNR